MNWKNLHSWGVSWLTIGGTFVMPPREQRTAQSCHLAFVNRVHHAKVGLISISRQHTNILRLHTLLVLFIVIRGLSHQQKTFPRRTLCSYSHYNNYFQVTAHVFLSRRQFFTATDYPHLIFRFQKAKDVPPGSMHSRAICCAGFLPKDCVLVRVILFP